MADSIDKKVEQIIERLSQSRDIVQYFQDIAKLTSLSAEDAKALQDALKGVAKSSKEVLGNFEDASKGIKTTVQAQKDLNKSLKTQQSLGIEINKQLKTQGFTQQEIKTILSGTADEREYLLKLAQNALDIDLGAITAAVDANKYQAENIAQAEDNLRIAQNYNTALGATGGLIGGVGEGLKKLGFDFGIVNDALTEAKEKMVDVAEEVTSGGQKAASFGDKVKVMGSGLKSLGGSIAKGLTDPLVLAEQFVDKLVEVDDGAGKLAKNFGISYDQALGISGELTKSANTAYLLNVTAAGQAEAFTEINNRYGTFAQISAETLETHQRLKDTVGLSSEALGAIADSSILTGKETEDITTEFLGQAKALALQNNLALNEKQILESVKDISKATLVSLQGQPQALAKAVVQAKALGTTVEKVADISNSLLQFEDSITSELEAELLIGKDLTLEKARQAALNNDIATVAEEIAKQVGTAAQFGEMNVLQQEALAKAVGMTREDLAASLTEREALAKLAGVEGASAKERFDNLVKEVGMEEAKKRLGDESLANMLASQNIQEKFNAGVSKLGDVLTALAVPVLQIVSPLIDLVNFVLPAINLLLSPLIEGFSLIGKAVSFIANGIKDSIPLAATLGGLTLILARRSIMSAIGSIFTSLGQIPFGVGLLLAGATVAGMISLMSGSATAIKDGMIAPDGGLMVSGEKGTYKLDKNDTVIAGTDLGGGGGGGRSTGIDIGPLVAEMQNIKVVLQQILAKEGSVYIDSTKAGTAFAVGTSKLQ